MLKVVPAVTLEGTAEDITRNLNVPGVRITAPGFYLLPQSTILVLPIHDQKTFPKTWEQYWAKVQPEGVQFTCHVYNVPFEWTIYHQCAGATVRLDVQV